MPLFCSVSESKYVSASDSPGPLKGTGAEVNKFLLSKDLNWEMKKGSGAW